MPGVDYFKGFKVRCVYGCKDSKGVPASSRDANTLRKHMGRQHNVWCTDRREDAKGLKFCAGCGKGFDSSTQYSNHISDIANCEKVMTSKARGKWQPQPTTLQERADAWAYSDEILKTPISANLVVPIDKDGKEVGQFHNTGPGPSVGMAQPAVRSLAPSFPRAGQRATAPVPVSGAQHQPPVVAGRPRGQFWQDHLAVRPTAPRSQGAGQPFAVLGPVGGAHHHPPGAAGMPQVQMRQAGPVQGPFQVPAQPAQPMSDEEWLRIMMPEHREQGQAVNNDIMALNFDPASTGTYDAFPPAIYGPWMGGNAPGMAQPVQRPFLQGPPKFVGYSTWAGNNAPGMAQPVQRPAY